MVWHLTADVDEFEDAAGEFLRADPVRNTVLLSVAAALRTSGATAYGDGAPCSFWPICTRRSRRRRAAPDLSPKRTAFRVLSPAVSRRGLDAGHHVVLFTDMANPTSNALYQRLGFRALGRWSELKLA